MAEETKTEDTAVPQEDEKEEQGKMELDADGAAGDQPAPEDAADAPMEDGQAEGGAEEAVNGTASEDKAASEGAAAEGTAADAKDEAPKEEEPKEKEQDFPDDDARPRLQGKVVFSAEAKTLNAMQVGDNLLMTLKDKNLQNLFAGARGNVGVKTGRYMFEAVVVEENKPSGSERDVPRPLIRLGLATDTANLLLDVRDGGCVCFDSEGYFSDGKSRTRVQGWFSRDQVVGILLNLDAASPNANTVSIFINGARCSDPMPLPEELHGKTLFPAVSYRCATVRINFGPICLRPLPFTCRMWQTAAVEDAVVVTAGAQPEDGRPEVIFPIALPDEGMTDWCENFLGKNAAFTEVSHRAISSWVSKSSRGAGPTSEEETLQRILVDVAPLLPRSLVLADVQRNLMPAARKAALNNFASSDFKRTALVLLGEPPEEHKEFVRSALLAEKRTKAAESARRKQNVDRLREKREPKNAKTEEEAKDDKNAEQDAEAAAEAIELTEEEKKQWYRKGASDMSQTELAKCFANFALPSEEEGFDSIRFEWLEADKAKEYLQEWMQERKQTMRVEHIEPSKWFKDRWAEWQKAVQEWKKKQTEWKDVLDTLNKWKAEGKDADDDKPTDIDADELDVFSVENVTDIGRGEPLFAKFEFEDWAMLSLRYELHLLVYAFRQDVEDPERKSFSENHLSYYYNKYFKKIFTFRFYGVEKAESLIEWIKDTMDIGGKASLLEPQLPVETPIDNFIKLTEQDRRDRKRRLEAGDETAALKFYPDALKAAAPASRPASRAPANPPTVRGSVTSSRYGSSSERVSTAPPARGSSSAYGSRSGGNDSSALKRPAPQAPREPPPKTARVSSAAPPARSGPQSSRATYSGSTAAPAARSGGGASGAASRTSWSGYSSSGYDRNSGSYDRGSGYDRGGKASSYDRSSYDKGGSYDRSSGYDRGSYDRSSGGSGYSRGGSGYDRGNSGGSSYGRYKQ